MIAVVAALEDEAAGLLAKLEGARRFSISGSPAWEGELAGRPLLLARSGPGRARAEAASSYLLGHYPLSAMLGIGFAGAVQEGLRVGDLVLCERVHAQGEAEPQNCDAALLQQAAAALQGGGRPFHRGDALTVPQVLGEPQDKAEVGRRLPVAVVEMEGYWLAQAAGRQGVPFLALRVVLDEVGDWLPDENFLDESGAVQRHRAMAYLMRHPERTAALMRLGAAVAKAGQSLAAGVTAILEGWES